MDLKQRGLLDENAGAMERRKFGSIAHAPATRQGRDHKPLGFSRRGWTEDARTEKAAAEIRAERRISATQRPAVDVRQFYDFHATVRC